MRKFFYEIMTGARKGILYFPIFAVMYLVSLVYGVAIGVRTVFYRIGLFRSRKAPLKVISVGNLTLGGTGKTPFVIFLAKIFKDELKREACVLTKGYGWDEQAMLKKNLTDTPILVGEDRVKLADRADRKSTRLNSSHRL